MLRPMILTGCLLLTGCIAGPAIEGAALEGLAGRAALGGAVAEGAGAAAAGEAMAASRFVIAPEVASSIRLAAGLADSPGVGLGAMVDGTGVVRFAGGSVARMEGASIIMDERVIATIQDGVVYRDGAGALGRFRGFVPRAGVRLEFPDGSSAANVRPMLVDVLRMQSGRYLVRLASGEEALVPAEALTLAILALAGDDRCDALRGPGVLVRTSGEPIVFQQCEPHGDYLTLTTATDEITVDLEEVRTIHYDPDEMRLAEMVRADQA